jgi:Fe/S biogenesis protein NfuA
MILGATKMLLTVTEAAQSHFRTLLQQEEVEGTNLRVYVANPETPQAEIGVTFCPPGEEEQDDISIPLTDFSLFVDKASERALSQAKIDFENNEEGGQLSIKAPNLKGHAPAADSPLSERIAYVLEVEVGPTLAGHGGRVRLVELIDNRIAVLEFGGGCHGCGMANVTLKNGIEKVLKEKFPEITEVRDVTDHASGENPYY